MNQASKGLKTGKAAPPKDVKSNAFDQMEDLGEPVLADDPPLEEEDEEVQDDENDDIGIIGQQPGDNKIIP